MNQTCFNNSNQQTLFNVMVNLKRISWNGLEAYSAKRTMSCWKVKVRFRERCFHGISHIASVFLQTHWGCPDLDSM